MPKTEATLQTYNFQHLILGVPYSYLRCNRSELRTTEMELNAMAAEAIMGLSLPSAATGIATVL